MNHISFVLFSYLFLNPFLARNQPEAPPQTGDPMVSFRRQLWVVGEKDIQNYCRQVQNDRRRIYYLINRRLRMNFQVKGIYTHQGLLFFRLAISNHSHLDYEVDSIRFFMRDSKGVKRNIPPTSLHPMYSYGNTSLIKGKTREESVLVLPQFTLPADKWLIIEVSEKQGGRRLELLVNNFTLLRSRLIP
jgi:conjugative transposon TraN protein